MFKPEKIKELRLKMMLSQVEFAKRLNVASETVNRYENGKSQTTFKGQRKLAELMKQYEIEVQQ